MVTAATGASWGRLIPESSSLRATLFVSCILSMGMGVVGCGETPAPSDSSPSSSESADEAGAGTAEDNAGDGGSTGGDASADGSGSAGTDSGNSEDSQTDESGAEETADESSEDSQNDDDGDDEGIWEGIGDPVLNYIRVTPANLILETDLEQPLEQRYEAMGVFSDNSEVDLTQEVEWSFTSNIGRFDGSTLEIDPFDELHVERAFVQAELDGVDWSAQVTVVAYDQSSKNPDFLFVLPFEDPNGEQSKKLTFETGVQQLDVFFSMDATGSMGGEIANLAESLVTDVIPGVQSAVPDSQFGAGTVRDFPILGFGAASDQPFYLDAAITDSATLVSDAVEAMKASGGSDVPESNIEALYQIATGNGLSGPGATFVESNHAGIGGVEFRAGSLPVIVPITDAVSHSPKETRCVNQSPVDYNDAINAVAATREATKAALDDICGRVITIASGAPQSEGDECHPRYDGEDFANSTGAKVLPVVWSENRPATCAEGQCCTGLNGAGREPDADGLCPLVFEIAANGSGLGESVVNGIKALVLYAPVDVVSEATGERASVEGKKLPDSKTSLDFLTEIRPDSWGDLPLDGLPDPVLTDDGFEGVTPGTTVTFEITAFNEFLPQINRPQVFRAKLAISADQCTLADFDEREILLVVPPKALGEG